MVSLAELRARNVTPSWQEAVAVIQELIQTVKATSGSAELLPDLEHIALIPNGDVVALPGSPEPAMPVRHAAVMLKLLVDDTPVPPELDQFITRNVTDSPQYDTVAEFSRNLAFFERPGRRSDVERLVGRAIAAEQTSRAEEELKRLKERASEVTQVMTPPEFMQQQKKPQTVPIAAVAALGVVVVGAGLWLLTRVRAPQPAAAVAETQEATAPAGAAPAGDPAGAAPGAVASTATTPASSAGATAPGAAPPSAADASAPTATDAVPAAGAPTRRSLLERAGDAIKSAVNSLVGSETPPAAAPAPASSPAVADMKPANGAPNRPRRSTTAAAAKAAPAPAVPSAPATAPPPAAVATSAVVVPEAPRPEPGEEVAVAIFTAADPSVTPPVIVRPVLPKDPPPNVPPEQIGTIDIIVDEQGDVVSVKLISPANRYHERMLVSATKMWKFRPAYKDGHPVRYKTRVRLTI